jgi:hypothetical protein
MLGFEINDLGFQEVGQAYPKPERSYPTLNFL